MDYIKSFLLQYLNVFVLTWEMQKIADIYIVIINIVLSLFSPSAFLRWKWFKSEAGFTQIYVVAERKRPPNSSSGASVQQSVGSNPGHDTCVPERDT